MTIARHVKHASLALIALSSVGVLQRAYANGTPSGTTINNQATVDYSVGGVNSDPDHERGSVVRGRHAASTSTCRRSARAQPSTSPGQVNVVTTFQLTNTGNSTQGYVLTAANEPTTTPLFGQQDNQDVNNLAQLRRQQRQRHLRGRHRHRDQHQLADHRPRRRERRGVHRRRHPGRGDQQPVRQRAPDCTSDGRAGQHDAAGAQRSAPTPRASTSCSADAGRDNSESAADQYHIRSAALTLNKTAAIISDPFNGTGIDRKAIPGAVIEYTITVTNNSTTTAADAVTVTDNIPANTTLRAGQHHAERGRDCRTRNFIAGLRHRMLRSVQAASLRTAATATVTFRVTINN